jgi:hypothetical protein
MSTNNLRYILEEFKLLMRLEKDTIRERFEEFLNFHSVLYKIANSVLRRSGAEEMDF